VKRCDLFITTKVFSGKHEVAQSLNKSLQGQRFIRPEADFWGGKFRQKKKFLGGQKSDFEIKYLLAMKLLNEKTQKEFLVESLIKFMVEI